MERNTNTPGTEMDVSTAQAVGGATDLAETAPLETGGRLRGRLVAGWRFVRHLLEMVVTMMVGMAALGVVLAVLGEPPGYANLFVRYGLMGVFMAVPMVAWMRFRGHAWADGGEMTGAMLLPTFVLVAPVELGFSVPGLSEGSLMTLSHVAMIGGMVVLMVYRFDRYAHGSHERRVREGRRASSD
jgi:hypothetical protein